MENNKSIIISFRTTTDAMAFEKFCMNNKVAGKLISVPKEIDAGCGLAWEIKINYENAKNDKIEDFEMSKLNEMQYMVNSNNLKYDKIVMLEKHKMK